MARTICLAVLAAIGLLSNVAVADDEASPCHQCLEGTEGWPELVKIVEDINEVRTNHCGQALPPVHALHGSIVSKTTDETRTVTVVTLLLQNGEAVEATSVQQHDGSHFVLDSTPRACSLGGGIEPEVQLIHCDLVDMTNALVDMNKHRVSHCPKKPAMRLLEIVSKEEKHDHRIYVARLFGYEEHIFVQVKDDADGGPVLIGTHPQVCEMEDSAHAAYCAENKGSLEVDAGEDMDVKIGDSVTLEGYTSHSELSFEDKYYWKIVEIPLTSTLIMRSMLSSELSTSFTPDVAGRYVIEFHAEDVCGKCHDVVVINVLEDVDPTPKQPDDDSGMDCSGVEKPSVDAGEDVTVLLTEADHTVVIDGHAAHDDKAGAMGTVWRFNKVPRHGGCANAHPDEDAWVDDWGTDVSQGCCSSWTGVIATNNDTVTFTPDCPGLYELEMEVSDECGDSRDIVLVRAYDRQPCNDLNLKPVAKVSGETEGMLSKGAELTISLDGHDSTDPDTHPSFFTYKWTITEVPDGSHVQALVSSGENLDSAFSFVPDVEGEYHVLLTVSDRCSTDTALAVVTIGHPDTGLLANAHTHASSPRTTHEHEQRVATVARVAPVSMWTIGAIALAVVVVGALTYSRRRPDRVPARTSTPIQV